MEVLERKGLLNKQEVCDVITVLRRVTPHTRDATPLADVIPEPYLMRDTEDRVLQGFSICST